MANQVIGTGGNIEVHSRIMIASNGDYFAAYRDNDTGNLFVSKSTDGGSTWTPTNSSQGVVDVAACIDGEDILHIVYQKISYIVAYRTFSEGSFGSEETIFDGTSGTDIIDGVDIAINSSDIPRVIWEQDTPGSSDQNVYYSERDSGSWASRTKIESEDVHAERPQLHIDENDFEHAIWVDSLDGVVSWSKKETTSFTSPVNIASGVTLNDGIGFDAVIDSSNNVHVIFHDDESGDDSLNYLKYDAGTESWGTDTEIFDYAGEAFQYVTICVDTSDNLTAVFTNSDNINIITSTDGGSTWSSSSEIIDETDDALPNRGCGPRWPFVEGVNTQIPSSGYFFDYKHNTSPEEYKLHTSSGLTLQTPVTDYYSREDKDSLPTDDQVLDTIFTSTGYSNVESDDNVYEDQTATDDYAIFVFKNRAENDTDNIDVTWRGKTDIAPSTSTVTLQIYNHNTSSWETLDSDSTTAADTEFELTGSKTSSLSDYYKNNWVTCRVYQLAQ